MRQYDTPEDEQAAEDERARRADRLAEHTEPEPYISRPQRIYAAGLWDAKRGCMAPDNVGVVVYPEDYL